MNLIKLVLLSWLCAWSLTLQASSSASSACSVSITDVSSALANSDGSKPHPGQWESVTLPDNWSKRWPDHNGAVWYQINWQHNCPKSPQTPPVAIAINFINMAGEVYHNNALLWQDKHRQEPLSRSWNTPRYWVVPSATLHSEGNQLWVKVIGYALQSPGLGTVQIGDVAPILEKHETDWWNQRTVFLINIILSITLGLICFSIWLLRRQEQAFGWFALASVFWVGFIANILATETWPFPNGGILAKANLSFFIGYIYCFCLFTWRFANRHFPKTEKAFLCCNVLSILVIWLGPISILKVSSLIIFLLYVFIVLISSLFFQYLAYRAKQLEQWLLAITLLLCLLLAVNNILDFFGFSKSIPIILPYTSTIVALFLTLILAMRLTRSLKHIEKFNQELSEKIVAAQNELGASLANKHVMMLKNSQLQERLKLSHDLHDGLGSSLVRAMASVDQSQKPISNEQFMSMLKLLRNDLRQIVDSGANANTKLPVTPVAWLAPLRHRFLQLFDELETVLVWTVPKHWPVEPSTLQCLTLYRVLEEALTNIVKHSEATQVTVVFNTLNQTLVLSIQDNGVGFDVEAVNRSGFSVGMRSMQARMARLGGHIVVTSEKNNTLIRASLPLHTQDQERIL